MRRIKATLQAVILISILLATPISLLAADKNGVSPTTISLPSGPGSIEGLGGAFQPQLNTGSAVYEIKIATPPGVNGHAPSLALYYNSGTGDSPVGIGWNFGPGSIRRKTDRGIPRYVDGPNSQDDDYDWIVDELDEQDQYLAPDGNDLVTDTDGSFRSRIESGFVRYIRHKDASADHWEAQQKNGVKQFYGLTAESRITSSDGTKIFRWLLSKEIDINGNVIEYKYASFPGSDNQKYLTEIRWGAGESPWSYYYFVYLSYETRPDWRKDYRSGFLVKTAHRLKEIVVGVHGVSPPLSQLGDLNDDGNSDALIRKYEMTYGTGGDEGLYLNKVTQFASDGINTLPPIRFNYIQFNPGPSISAAEGLIGSQNTPVEVMDNPSVELIDFNNDGLPDILHTDPGGLGQSIYLNQGAEGEGSAQTVNWANSEEVLSEDGQALGVNLNEDSIHLADMDGDGLADLVQTTLVGDIYYFSNQANMSWGAKIQMNAKDTNPPAPFTNADIVTADMDFDKRIDVVKSSENGYSIWFNLGNGEYSSEFRTAGATYLGQTLLFSNPTVRRADLNGDRMTDVAKINATEVIYAANMGHGNFEEGLAIAIPDYDITNLINQAQLHDINGDGLDDLVIERATANELWYWLNLGTDQFSNRYVITDMPSTFNINTVTRWADMNGNGTTDLVYADSDGTSRLILLDVGVLENLPGPPNVLSRVDNGLGVVTDIIYKSSSEYYIEARENGTPWSSTIPFNVAVIAREEITTGLDVDEVAGIDQYVKEYNYNDPFYDIHEKSFRGFAQAQATEVGDSTAPDQVSTFYFFTGGPDGIDNDNDGSTDEVSAEGFREEEPLRGKTWKSEVANASGDLFNTEETEWLVRNLFISQEGTEVRFAYKNQTEKSIYEGTLTPEILRNTYQYDDYGNITEEKNYGSNSLTGDEIFTFNQYITDTTNWILDRIHTETKTDNTETTQAETRFYYDGASFLGLTLGQLRDGNLTRKEGWVSAGSYIDLESYERDSYGNISGKKDGKGNLRTLSYDSLFNTFPTQETIEVGGGKSDLVVAADYHFAFGKISQSTDFNGQTTDYTYDAFGRPISVVKPGDSAAFPTIQYSYELADPSRDLLYLYNSDGQLNLVSSTARPSAVKTQARKDFGQADTFDTIQYLDGAGRKLAKIEDGESSYIVREAVRLNARGKTGREFLPYATGTNSYQVPTLANAHTRIHYDATLREILRINPETDQGITQNSKQYLPLATTETDENGHLKTLFQDGLERIIKVHEENQGETYITQYQYDILGNLTQITDAQNNIKTMTYDGLGRKTFMNDPDKGQMDYQYDDAGNLVQTTDAKTQVIVYDYDGANRIISEDYQDARNLTPDVAYTYDLPSADYPATTHTKGKISSITDLSGGEFFSYDARGNVIWQVKRIKDGTSDAEDYVSQASYDAMDRKIQYTYPDNTTIQYTYNNQILLESIPGFLPNIDYEVSGKYSNIQYANNIQTTYSYDNRQRLKTLYTENSDGEALQDLTYLLDGVGNILSITDGRGLPADSPANASQQFQYDDLDRLTRGEGAYGRIDYQYDKIGNMVQKGSPAAPDLLHVQDKEINLGTLAYGGAAGANGRNGRNLGDAPGPHAVTSTTSGFVYDYDDNGNMISHETGEIYSWDFRDRLTQVQTETDDAEYIYDSNGQRIIKKVNGVRTVSYISDEYEIRNGQILKFIFAGNRRIARINTDPAQPNDETSQSILLQPGWNFFSLTVQPDNTNITNVLQSIEDNYSEVYAYDTESRSYQRYLPGESFNDLLEIVPGKGYLIYMTNLATLTIKGSSAENPIQLKIGWNLTASPVTNTTSPTQAISDSTSDVTAIWSYNPTDHSWQRFITDSEAPSFLSTLTEVEPGNSYWINASNNTLLTVQTIDLGNIIYYHPDHLGSTNFTTTQAGTIVSRLEYYPYGKPRYQEQLGFDPAYKYTDKELDVESGLMYYEARYYDSTINSFINVDPLFADLGEEAVIYRLSENPQESNLLTYGLSNPISNIDPDGRIVDTIIDILSIVYDAGALVYDEIKTGGKNRKENLAALGADVACAATPFATGGGIAVRAGNKLTKIKKPFKVGGSGKPRRHFVKHKSKKSAKDAAGQKKYSAQEFHSKRTARGQRWHYHNKNNRSTHHQYGKKKKKK